jgi:DnaK suppressor protein
MSTTGRNGHKKREGLEQILTSRRDALRSRIHGHLDQVFIDREPDDEAALASDSVSKDMAVAALERERRTLQEIESALERIKKGSYGICTFCGEAISEVRLQALPWARLCIECAGKAASSSAAAD